MNVLYYIDLDIHKKTIAYCIKEIDGVVPRGASSQGRSSKLLRLKLQLDILEA